MPTQKEQDLQKYTAMVTDADAYLTAWALSPAVARGMALEDVGRWGKEFLSITLGVAGGRLEEMFEMNSGKVPFEVFREKAIEEGTQHIEAIVGIADLRAEFEGSLQKTELTGTPLAYYEDMRALGSLALAERADVIKQDDKYKHYLMSQIFHAYDGTQGTACKMALAYLLHSLGDDSKMKSSGFEVGLQHKRKFLDDAIGPITAQLGKETADKMVREQWEKTMRSSIIEIVAIDTASRGTVFTNFLDGEPWVPGKYQED